MASIEERVIDIVAEQLGVEKDKIGRDTHFVNDLGADSLDTVELVMELEEEFDIRFSMDHFIVGETGIRVLRGSAIKCASAQ